MFTLCNNIFDNNMQAKKWPMLPQGGGGGVRADDKCRKVKPESGYDVASCYYIVPYFF